jgi:4-hydroxy-3-methylbut-2-enyl diphosphate reductase
MTMHDRVSAATVGAMPEPAGRPGKRVLLAEPRGYCAGVDRAVETV